jgi:tape measure domain-containing protein
VIWEVSVLTTVISAIKHVEAMSESVDKLNRQLASVPVHADKMNQLVSGSCKTCTVSLVDSKSIVYLQQLINLLRIRNTTYQQMNIYINQQNILHQQQNTLIHNTNNTFKQTNHILNQNLNVQQNMNQAIQDGGKKAGSLLDKLKGLKGAAKNIFQNLQAVFGLSDQYMMHSIRLNHINDGSQTTQQLQDKIFAAANRSRQSYADMANIVGRMGASPNGTFKSNDELIAFSELMVKSFRISGSPVEEQQAGMEQLSKAMAFGQIKSLDFEAIVKTSPMLAKAISDVTGKSTTELSKMAAEGALTAEMIKTAMFAAADEINRQFDSLPRTFGEMFSQLNNSAFHAFGPVFKKLNEWLNSSQGSAILQTLTSGLYFAGRAADVLLGALIWIADTVEQNWAIIEPILVALGSALLTQILPKLWAMIPPLQSAIGLLIKQFTSWLALNWPILLIGAAIGLLIYALYQWGDVVTEIIGFVGGIFGMLFAFLYNKFAYFANMVLSVAEFFINVWRDPVYAVKKLFYDLVINSLTWLQNLAKGIESILNKIPGLEVNLTDGLSKIVKRLDDARDNLKSEEDVVNLMRFKQIGYGEAFDFGQKIGRSVGKFVSDGVQTLAGKIGNMFSIPESGSYHDSWGFAGVGETSGLNHMNHISNIGRVDEVGQIRDTVNISGEDLQMMRELAEMNSIQNFVTLTPTVNVQTGDIRSGYDVDTMITRIETFLTEQISSSAKGVYSVG